MKNTIVETIISNLKQQLELQLLLQSETARLRGCILKRLMEDISGVTHRIDEITGTMELLEIDRRRLISESEYGEEAAHSFDLFLRNLPETSRESISIVRMQLREIAKETYRLNAGNRILLEEALSSVKTTVTILTTSGRTSTGYDYNGKTSTVNRKKILNRVG